MTFVPSSVTPAINPLLVRTNASIGPVAVELSMLPLAPTFRTATDASPPADHPSLLLLLLRNRAGASCGKSGKSHRRQGEDTPFSHLRVHRGRAKFSVRQCGVRYGTTAYEDAGPGEKSQ